MTVPDLGELNPLLIEATRSFSERQGYAFTPTERPAGSDINPRDPHYDGVQRDIVWDGDRVARARADGGTYCCGVTFEVFVRAWQVWSGTAGIAGLDPDEIRALITEWFCPTLGHSGVVSALVTRELGAEVDQEQARAGDLCQFWRRVELDDPSGHSVVFLGFGMCDGQRTIEYWSSQKATGGVGVHTEVIEPGWTLHLARVGRPSLPLSQGG
jgi:hypothetical protein